MNCPYCQTVNRKQAIFCKECGRLLGTTCPNCRSSLPDAAKFCDICGHDLSQRVARLEAVPTSVGQEAYRAAPQSAAVPKQSGSQLQQYVPRELMAKLADAQSSGGMVGERRIVTMLFCDVKDSTSAAEQLDPEEWSDIINGAFEHMIAPIYRYEGIVARLMGDGILAFFGAPIAHEDDPVRALLAGLDIVSEISSYRTVIGQRHGIDIDLRVGINTGRVVVGAVGSDLRLEYTALGDAINVAARMEQTAAPGTVQIAEDTYRLVAPLFDFEDLGAVAVKGKREPVSAFRVLGRKAEPGQLRGIAGQRAPLIGRDAEMAKLQEALNELSGGRGRPIFVTGQAGLGKTRLVHDLCAHWQANGKNGDSLQFWIHRPVASYQASEPYRVLKSQLRLMYNIPEGVTPLEAADSLRQHIDAMPAADQPGVYEPLARILGVVGEEDADQSVDGETFKRQLLSASTAVVKEQVGQRPAVLVLEDLHWADPASIEVIQHLFELVHGTPILFLCITRPDRSAASWQLKEQAAEAYPDVFQEMVLNPLSQQDSQKMLEGLLSGMVWPADLLSLILEKAEGNPFFIEEVVRTLIESDVIHQDEYGQWQAQDQLDDFVVPGSLQALLATRIDRLSDEERRVLQAASVIGRSFRRAVLQRAIDDDIDLDKVLQALVRADLIEVEDQTAGSYRFRNSLAQDTVYRSILRRTRRAYHRRVGEALLLTGDQAAEHLPALAHHFYQAQDQRALPFNKRAGDQAHELFANKEAAIYYSRAIEMAQLFGTSSTEELAQLYMSRGRVLELASSFSEALDNYREMGEVAEKRQDRPMALAALVATGTIFSTANENYNAAEAESLAEEALVLAQELGDEASEAKIQWNLMNTYRLSERPPLALSAGERSLELARKNDLREQLAYTANDMTHVYMSAGLPEKAQRTVTEAISLWRELGNQQMLADSLSTATLLTSSRGEYEETIALSDEAFQISQATKNLWGQSYSRMGVCQLYWLHGEPDRAIETMSESVRLGEMAGFVVAPIYIGAMLALTYAYLGDYDRAVSMTERSVAESKANIPYYEPLTLSTLGQIYLLAGRMQDAQRVFEEIMTNRGYLEPMLESSVEEGMSRYYLAQNEFKQAIRSARNLLSVLSEIHSNVWKSTALHLYGQALLGNGQLEDAGEALGQALSEAKRLELLWPLWQIQATLADWAEARGEQEEATDYRQQARHNLETIAGRISDQKLRDSFVARAGLQALA